MLQRASSLRIRQPTEAASTYISARKVLWATLVLQFGSRFTCSLLALVSASGNDQYGEGCARIDYLTLSADASGYSALFPPQSSSWSTQATGLVCSSIPSGIHFNLYPTRPTTSDAGSIVRENTLQVLSCVMGTHMHLSSSCRPSCRMEHCRKPSGIWRSGAPAIRPAHIASGFLPAHERVALV